MQLRLIGHYIKQSSSWHNNDVEKTSIAIYNLTKRIQTLTRHLLRGLWYDHRIIMITATTTITTTTLTLLKHLLSISCVPVCPSRDFGSRCLCFTNITTTPLTSTTPPLINVYIHIHIYMLNTTISLLIYFQSR